MGIALRMSSLLLAVVLLAGGASMGAWAQEPKTVRIGLTPFFDYQAWGVAQALGLDKEQGIALEPVAVTSGANGVAALRQGSLDLTASSQVGAFPFYKQVPALRTWIILDQFKGFIVVGRKGKTDTFGDLSAKVGPAKAKEDILNSFRGKTFVINPTNFLPLVKAAIGQVGLTVDQVKIAEFPDDAKAALAFETGVGDFYMGSLPQEAKLLSQPDRYVNVGGHEILGDAGLWFSSTVGLAPWLESNKETVMKLLAVWYRTVRYINEKPDSVIATWTKRINQQAAAAFTEDDMRNILKLLYYPNIEEAKKTFYNKESPLYWKRSINYYVPQNADKLPADFDSGKYNIEETLFLEFLKRNDLIAWVNSPLK